MYPSLKLFVPALGRPDRASVCAKPLATKTLVLLPGGSLPESVTRVAMSDRPNPTLQMFEQPGLEQ